MCTYHILKKKKKVKCDNDIAEIRGEKSGPSINV